MAKMLTKGAVITHVIADAVVPIAQIISFGHSGGESETFDSTTIDTAGSGKEYLATGYSEGGSFDFTCFFDSALAGHQNFGDLVTNPGAETYAITLAGGAAMGFAGAGISFGFSGDMGDGIKGDVSIKLNQLMAYTT